MIRRVITELVYYLFFPKRKVLNNYESKVTSIQVQPSIQLSYDSSNYNVVPETFKKRFFWLEFYKKGHKLEEVNYCSYSNVRIQSTTGAIITRKRRLVGESVRLRRYYLRQTGAWKLVLKSVSSRKYGTYFSTIDILGRNYYHFVIDILTKFDCYEAYIGSGNDTPQVLVNQSPSRFQLEWLHLFGVPDINIKELKENSILEKVIVPSVKTKRFITHDNKETHLIDNRGFEWLRNKVVPRLKTNFQRGKYVYVSRKKCFTRDVFNNKEFDEFLKSVGFKEIVIEDYSVQEQLEIFSSSEKIISPHGAGLTNLIFADSRCSVIELFPDTRYPDCASIYYQITEQIKIKHTLLVCKTVDENENMIVDTKLLGKVLNEEY